MGLGEGEGAVLTPEGAPWGLLSPLRKSRKDVELDEESTFRAANTVLINLLLVSQM